MGIFSARDAIIGVQSALGGRLSGNCTFEMTDDPVDENLTVTAEDCIIFYDNMRVPPEITVGVAVGGMLIDRG